MKLICYLFYPDSIKYISRLVKSLQMQSQASEVIIIFNKKNLTESQLETNLKSAKLIAYDGTDWEFGAYQLGIDSIYERPTGGVLIINDTAGRNYPLHNSHLERLFSLARDFSQSDTPTIIGKIETKGEFFEIKSLTFASWIRSNVFFLNLSAIEALSSTIFDRSVFITPKCKEGTISFGGITSKNLEEYIQNWLCSDNSKHGWLAHAGKKSVNDDLIARKAGSILLEKYLSARVINAGGRLVTYESKKTSLLSQLQLKFFYLSRRFKRFVGKRA